MSKIVFIDVDGTLTMGKPSWALAHSHFEKLRPGMIEGMKKNMRLWEAGEISYHEWAIYDVELWKGIPIEELNKALMSPKLIKGAKEGIDMLNAAGFKTVLVSGGIDVMVDEVKRLVGADEAYSNTICAENGVISGDVKLPVGGSKVEIIQKILHTHNMNSKQAYAIGDNVNDIEMFEFVNYAVGLNVKREKVEKYADKLIKTDTFIDVASHLVDISNL